HDPNEIVDIPDDIDLVDYDKEDLEEDPEEEPEEDVDIEDDAELIFPYEVEGDKTLPPRDVSSDFVSSDSESEDEEVDVVPDATVGTITQKPYVIRDFTRGLFEVGESSSARDSSHVDGLAPWALRRDLEASRAQSRVMEAELGGAGTGGAGAGGVGADGAGAGGARADGAGVGGTGVGGAGPAAPEITGCTDCKEKDKVKFATATLQGRALTWWNG
ncbi:hypothetical protein Tco_0113948, partial [Tanacetum coccineum]